MKILVYPHDLSIGGSQINAIDLAAGAAAAGHDVVVYGIPGPLVPYVEKRGLRFIPARRLRYRPAPSRIVQLARIARREKLDVIHAYEWPPCLDAYFGAGLLCGVPIVCTVLSMVVSPYVPSSVPLIMGTAELGEAARRSHRGEVWVLEPPIDTVQDRPGIDGISFRRKHGVGPDEMLVVTVSRLAIDLKLDALVRAIDASALLASRLPVRLILVGDGPARASLEQRAAAVNSQFKREVVTFAGAYLDPREAYASADVVIGMGSSCLRALAIGRPVVVQGEKGFSELFSPETLNVFLRQGFYGIGSDEVGSERLAAQIERLLVDRAYAEELGSYGRMIVVERFSLERAIPIQLEIYEKVLRASFERPAKDALQTAARAFLLEVKNHDPRNKRHRASFEASLLAAAGSGTWPPRLSLDRP